MDELQILRNEFSSKKLSIEAAKSFAKEEEGYTNEVNQQKLRLESINLFSEQKDNDICPLCSSILQNPIPTINEISKTLEELNTNLVIVEDERPRLREHIKKLEEEWSEIRLKIQQKQLDIESIWKENDNAKKLRDENSRIARIVGRISLFLDTKFEVEDNSLLHKQIEEAKRKVQYLESCVEPEIIEELITSKLNVISEYMTGWARELELEYPNFRYRLDIKKLTVIVDRPDRPITMERLGSSENWLGCHLITILALHKYFIEQNRPVPGFIILDQPSQGYFVNPETYKSLDGTTNNLENLQSKDADLVTINRMFELLFNVCESLFPNLQIIITEHANLGTDQFKEALIEEPWMGNKALIPLEWINPHSEPKI